MASAGIDQRTGKILQDFDHVSQSIGVILTTNIGTRIMREWFGFPGFALLGEPMNQLVLTRFLQLIAISLTLRQLNGLPAEPRFRVFQMVPLSAERDGSFSCRLDGYYMPRGHLGDTTVEGRRGVLLSQSGGSFAASSI